MPDSLANRIVSGSAGRAWGWAGAGCAAGIEAGEEAGEPGALERGGDAENAVEAGDLVVAEGRRARQKGGRGHP